MSGIDLNLVCDVCHDEPGVGVAAIPGVPISVAYGEACLKANAHPWEVLVANTELIGGLEEAADWWREMVEDTCRHLGRSVESFEAEVRRGIEEEEAP